MAMIEYLVSFVQCLCLLGYLYGAWLVITHKAHAGTNARPHSGAAAIPGRRPGIAPLHRLRLD